MFTAMLTGNNITMYDYIYFLSLTIHGNIIGGAVFVADGKRNKVAGGFVTY
jgi:formate/nitrite transporter FocA (FNT family)